MDNQDREFVNSADFWSGFPHGISLQIHSGLNFNISLSVLKTLKTILGGVGPNSSAGVPLLSTCSPGFQSPSRQGRFLFALIGTMCVCALKFPYLCFSLGTGTQSIWKYLHAQKSGFWLGMKKNFQ